VSIDILVTTQDPTESTLALPSGRLLFEELGQPDTSTLSIYVNELLERLFEQVRQTVDFPCNVEVTVAGSLTLTGKGEAKFLVLNVGGEAETQTTMTVKVSTTLPPVPVS
jgi:hypothetical protein